MKLHFVMLEVPYGGGKEGGGGVVECDGDGDGRVGGNGSRNNKKYKEQKV